MDQEPKQKTMEELEKAEQEKLRILEEATKKADALLAKKNASVKKPEPAPEPAKPEPEPAKPEEGYKAGDTVEFTVEPNPRIEPKSEKEQEIKYFIDSLLIEDILPPLFENLNEDQKLFVLQGLKQRIVDVVKSDAKTQYSEELRAKMVHDESAGMVAKMMNSFKNIQTNVKENFKKEIILKNLESEAFAKLFMSEDGKKMVEENLNQLVEMNKDRRVWIDPKGQPLIFFEELNNIENPTEEEEKTMSKFVEVANEFRQIPYEWGQEGKAFVFGHKREYERIKAQYEKSRNEILKIKEKREQTADKGSAMLEMLQLDNTLQLDQLLNTHPEVEKEFAQLTRDGGGKEYLKTALNSLQTITGGKNLTNKLLFAGGFLVRAGTKIAIGSASIGAAAASVSTFLAAPVIGGTIGGLRGRLRGQETLKERQKMARHGEKDKSAEAKNIVDAENLAKRMNEMVMAVENAPTSEKRDQYKDQLKRRIDYTQDKIENGLVNFGDAKFALINQFNLINNLNNALVASSLLEETTRKDVDARLENFLSYKSEKISEAQKIFLKDKMIKGVMIGAGAATAGYVLRYVGEELGWWKSIGEGIHKLKEEIGVAGNQMSQGGEGFIERSEKWISGVFGKLRHGESSHINKPRIYEEKINLERAATGPTGIHSKDNFQEIAKKAFAKNNVQDNTSPIKTGTPKIENIFKIEKVDFSSKGAIQTIENLKAQILKDYQSDISKAPHSVQEFMHTSSVQEAIKLGFYNPNDPSGAESALLIKGSSLGFDEHGNLSFHDIKTNQDHVLIHEQNNTEAIEKYQGKMFDSDHSNDNILPKSQTSPETIPHVESGTDLQNQQVNPETLPHVSDDGGVSSQVEPEKIPHMVAPIESTVPSENQSIFGKDEDFSVKEADLGKHLVEPHASPGEYHQDTTGGISEVKHVTMGDEKIGSHNEINGILNSSQLEEVKHIYSSNINHMFPDDKSLQTWETIKNSSDLHPAQQFVSWKGPIDKSFEPLLHHIQTLHEITGLDPITNTAIFPPTPETPEEYILRATEEAAKLGPEYLEKIKV